MRRYYLLIVLLWMGDASTALPSRSTLPLQSYVSQNEGLLPSNQDEMQVYLNPLIDAIPMLRDKQWVISSIASCSNCNFLLENGEGKYVLRVPRADSSLFTKWGDEKRNLETLNQIGLDHAQLSFYDRATGVMITRYLEGVRFLERDDFLDKANIEKAAHYLKTLHTSSAQFASEFDYFHRSATLYQKVKVSQHHLPNELERLVVEMLAIKERLNHPLFESLPCHNDPIFQNFAASSERFLLVDWEQSAMADPYWDLAVLASITHFTPEQEEVLLNAYGSASDERARYKLRFFTTLVHLQSCIWSYSKYVLKDYVLPKEILLYIYENELKLCQELFRSESFQKSVRILTKD